MVEIKLNKKVKKEIKEIKLRNYSYIEAYKINFDGDKEEISLPLKEYYDKYKVLRIENGKVKEKINAKIKNEEIIYKASVPGEYVLFGGNKKLPILAILIMLAIIVLMGSVIAYSKIPVVKQKVNEILHIDKPTAPEIGKDGELWQQKTLVKVIKDSYSYSGIDYYEYCVREKEDYENCKWKKTNTKNAMITKSGKYYVVFRGVSKEGNKGDLSNSIEVLVDNISPKINEVKIDEENQKLKIEINATDNLSGIKEYYYKIDDDEYKKCKKEIELENYKEIKKITILVIDEAGNEAVLEIDLTKVLEKVEENTENLEEPEEKNPEEQEGPEEENPEKPEEKGPDDENPKEKPGEDEEKPEEEIKKKLKAPKINLDEVPSEFTYGDSYKLPSYYEFDEQGGQVQCKVDNKIVKNTEELSIGNHTIICIAWGNNGLTAVTSKNVKVTVPEGEDEEWNGWIRITLFYPDNSTDWQWRIYRENETRVGEESGWQAYTGPIYVRIEDVENVYIKYKIGDEEVIVPPSGKLVVDIKPEEYRLLKEEKTKVKITYDVTATTKEYKINNGDWQEYTGTFEVEPNTLIEARAIKNEDVYDSIGDYVTTRKIQSTDAVYITEYTPINLEYEFDSSDSGDQGGSGNSGGLGNPGGSSNPTGSDDIPIPSTYLSGPIISQDTLEIVESTKVYVTPQEEASEIYISIDYGKYELYTGPKTVTKNCVIRAYYVRAMDGKVSATKYYSVQNIFVGKVPYVRIDVTPSKYLSEQVKEAEISISGTNYDKLEYSLDGVIYLPYTESFKVTSSTYVYAKGTNEYGEKIERVKISTMTPPAPKINLDVVITANPASAETPIAKTTIEIYYDERASVRYYQIGSRGPILEYQGPFEVTENTTIYAYARCENGTGYTKKAIDFLTTGITEPQINIEPETLTNIVKVTIDYAKTSVKNEYSINGGEWQEYEEPLEIIENETTIMARNTNLLGQSSTSSVYITNIIELPKYVFLDCGQYFILRLNYPTSSKEETREYKWQITGTWKHYKPRGILLIKSQFKDVLLENQDIDGIRVTDKDGTEIIFEDDYYVVDKPLQQLMENVFMRWETAKPKKPEFILSEEGITNNLRVGILYDSTSELREYKVINPDGTTEGWKEYTGVIEIEENGTRIFARSTNNAGSISELAQIMITNLDKDKPEINAVDVIGVGSSNITIRVNAEDITTDVVKYAYSLDDEEYVYTNAKEYTFKGLKKETDYKIHVKVYDEADNESEEYELEATTTDIGEITYLTTPTQEEWSIKKTVIINYPEDAYNGYVYEYSMDMGETWQPYTAAIEVTEAGTSIVARVVDGENIKSYATLTITKIDNTTPTISLEGLPHTVSKDSYQLLPISYTDGPSGSTRTCTISNSLEEYDNVNQLPIGEHTLTCTITTGVGLTASASKEINVVLKTIKGDSLLSILQKSSLEAGYYGFEINGTNMIYPVHLFVYNGSQNWEKSQTFGDENDVAASNRYAKNMVIVKVKGDLTVGEDATVQPYYDSLYGGPKGFILYVTGTLTNNGTIDNSHGAWAEGEDVYLWKNSDETYEFIPSLGAAGAWGTGQDRIGNPGAAGATVSTSPRATGGGGSGGNYGYWINAQAGSYGTSYSGGTGSGGVRVQNGGGAGKPYGGMGGSGYYGGEGAGGGAGNPGGPGNGSGANGTGGLLTIYANNYVNNGTISAAGIPGAVGGSSSGGGSGGGSINIFTNQPTGINYLGVITDDKYSEMLGKINVAGGGYSANSASCPRSGTNCNGGPGGSGTINIGEIRNGQYYDLKEIIEQDKITYQNSVTFTGDSILSIINKNIRKTGYYNLIVNGEQYSTHVIVYNGNQEWTTSQTFGDEYDVATSSTYAKNMVIVKVNGNLTIGEDATVQPYYDTLYGGPKGFALYVTGTLTNNGTIDNSHGAWVEGEDVYLWKNSDGTYEYVPAIGGAGGASKSANGANGNTISETPRATGGGGSGGGDKSGGNGTDGTSYSGGTGGSSSAGVYYPNPGNPYGGAGGSTSLGAGGAGNPGGSGRDANGENGTGGLLIIYANIYTNSGIVSARGTDGGIDETHGGGGSSGGGSINIFYNSLISEGTANVSGGIATPGKINTIYAFGGSGGAGTVNYTQIGGLRTSQLFSLRSMEIIEETIIVEEPKINISSSQWTTSKNVTINYSEGEYINEYSLDAGETWIEYTGEILINEPTTILARTRKNEKILSSSTFTITKIDNEEPEINILLEERILKNTTYEQIVNVKYTKSGGTLVCQIGDNTDIDIKTLEVGNYKIICTVTTGSGKITSKEKEFEIYEIVSQEEEEPLENTLPVEIEGEE